MEQSQCALCGQECSRKLKVDFDDKEFRLPFYECSSCGQYVMDELLQTQWEGRDDEDAFKLACLVREHQRAKKYRVFGLFGAGFPINEDGITPHLDAWWNVDDLLREFPVATQLMDRALANLATRASHPMDRVRVTRTQLSFMTFCKEAQIYDLMSYMDGAGLLGSYKLEPQGDEYTISPQGWSRLEQLALPSSASKQAFVAMWFDAETQDVYDQGIKSAIEKAGYECKRVDKVEHNNKICDEIVAEIRRSRFVIADFTGHRGGVYFEAGYAMGMGLPVVWLVSEDDLKDLHFDTRQYNHITYKNATELEAKLYNRIQATIH